MLMPLAYCTLFLSLGGAGLVSASSLAQSPQNPSAQDEELPADPARYRHHLESAVDMADGTITRAMGDGVVVFHETDDTSRLYTGWLKEDLKEDGKVKLWQVENGVCNGPSVVYYGNGNKCVSFTFVDGKIHGIHLMWNIDGNLLRKTRWEEGRPVESLPVD